jgi:hypothetical protein
MPSNHERMPMVSTPNDYAAEAARDDYADAYNAARTAQAALIELSDIDLHAAIITALCPLPRTLNTAGTTPDHGARRTHITPDGREQGTLNGPALAAEYATSARYEWTRGMTPHVKTDNLDLDATGGPA